VSEMKAETQDTEVLMLFLRHYLSLAGAGIEFPALPILEEELGKVINLAPEDFSIVTEQWKESGKIPSIAQFLESLRLEVRRRAH
jgi:hypothetical protein